MTVVAVAVIQKDGKILIARRKQRGPLQGRWEFPGGKVEGGESPEACVRREAAEELGIRISLKGLICSTVHDYEHETVKLMAYRACILSGVILNREYDEMAWVTPRDLPHYPFPEANGPLIEKLIQEGRQPLSR